MTHAQTRRRVGSPVIRWMTFVDGENLTIRAQKLAKNNGFSLVENEHYSKDAYLWMRGLLSDLCHELELFKDESIRHYYYTSILGDDVKVNVTRESLRNLGLEPVVFKKTRKDEKAKGVDIALTKDLLIHAFMDNYDLAVLVTGDRDYLPVIEEIKRLGKRLYLAFFSGKGLSPELQLQSDRFFDLTPIFEAHWRALQKEQESSEG